MVVGTVLKMVAAVGTIAASGASIFFPHSAESFTSLSVTGPRRVSEIRAVLGALFVGLGIAVLLFRSPESYRTLGIGYAAIALVRAADRLRSRSHSRSGSAWVRRSSWPSFASSSWVQVASQEASLDLADQLVQGTLVKRGHDEIGVRELKVAGDAVRDGNAE